MGRQYKQQKRDQQAQLDSIEREERFKKIESAKNRKKKIAIGITISLLAVIVASLVYGTVTPGRFDDFAKCLTEKGVVMQGENWCKYTNAQKGMFGKSFKYINYEENPNLRKRPTWIIDGKKYETVQSFQRLSELTGCDWRS